MDRTELEPPPPLSFHWVLYVVALIIISSLTDFILYYIVTDRGKCKGNPRKFVESFTNGFCQMDAQIKNAYRCIWLNRDKCANFHIFIRHSINSWEQFWWFLKKKFWRSTFVDSAWSFDFSFPATTANDLRLRRISIPDLIHCIIFLS